MPTIIVIILCILLLPGLIHAFASGVLEILAFNTIGLSVLVGLVMGGILHRFIRGRVSFLTTFEHELTHTVAALLCGRKVSKFVSTSGRGGYIQHEGGRKGITVHLIGLAPYYLPLFALFLVLLRPLLNQWCFPWFDGIIGAALGLYILNNIDSIKGNWKGGNRKITDFTKPLKTDFENSGHLRAVIIIAFMWIVIYGSMLYIISKGYPGILVWIGNIWEGSVQFYGGILVKVPSWLKGVFS